jgi:hypothetical protein
VSARGDMLAIEILIFESRLFQFVAGGASYKEYQSFTDWVESKLSQEAS